MFGFEAVVHSDNKGMLNCPTDLLFVEDYGLFFIFENEFL